MPVDLKQLAIQLRNLREWREEYYNGRPLVSDAIYDDVEDQVREAAKELPDGDKFKVEIEEFLAGVGAPVPAPVASSGKVHWKKAKHTAPAGSLNKAQGMDDAQGWFKDCLSKIGVSVVHGVWSEKLDGISCFDADTEIHLANGETLQIGELVEEDLRPRVLSWDPETGETTEQVVAVHDNGMRDNWIRLTLEDGSTILVTEDHLFYVLGEGWVPAKDILGKDLQTLEG